MVVMAIAMALLEVILAGLNTQSLKKYRGVQPIRSRGAADTEPHGSSNVSNPRKSWKEETLR